MASVLDVVDGGAEVLLVLDLDAEEGGDEVVLLGEMEGLLEALRAPQHLDGHLDVEVDTCGEGEEMNPPAWSE